MLLARAPQLNGFIEDFFDVAFSAGTFGLLSSEDDVCAAAKEMGRLVKPGGKAMIVSVPKANCSSTFDEEWDCPKCAWKLKV